MNTQAFMGQLTSAVTSLEGSRRHKEGAPMPDAGSLVAGFAPIVARFEGFPADITRASWGPRTPWPMLDVDSFQWHFSGDHTDLAQMFSGDPTILALLSNYRLINGQGIRTTWREQDEKHNDGKARSSFNLFVTRGDVSATVLAATSHEGTLSVPKGECAAYGSYQSGSDLTIRQTGQLAETAEWMVDQFSGTRIRGCVINDRDYRVEMAFSHTPSSGFVMCGPGMKNLQSGITGAQVSEAFSAAYLPLRSGGGKGMAYLAFTVPGIR